MTNKALLLLFTLLTAVSSSSGAPVTFQWSGGGPSYALYECITSCPEQPPLPGVIDIRLEKLAEITTTQVTLEQSPGPHQYAVCSISQGFPSLFSAPITFNVPVIISGHISYCLGGFEAGVGLAGTITDAQGYYRITVPVGTNLTLTPIKNGPTSRIINTIDLVAIQNQFIHPSWTGCRRLAADVNLDGRVDTTDIVAIQRYIFNHPWGNIGKYLFSPQSATHTGVTSDIIQDFTCYVPGDVQ